MSNLLRRKRKTMKNLELYFLLVGLLKNVFKMFGIWIVGVVIT